MIIKITSIPRDPDGDTIRFQQTAAIFSASEIKSCIRVYIILDSHKNHYTFPFYKAIRSSSNHRSHMVRTCPFRARFAAILCILIASAIAVARRRRRCMIRYALEPAGARSLLPRHLCVAPVLHHHVYKTIGASKILFI